MYEKSIIRNYVMKASIAAVEKKESKISAKHDHLARALKLQGMAESTTKCYLRSFRRVCEYFDRLPDYLLVSEFEQYFADLIDTHSWSTVKIDLGALVFYWKYVLKRKWKHVEIVRPPRVNKIPDILTISEVSQILAHAELLRFRVVLFTIYSMGLRVSEGVNIRVADIDSEKMQIHIRNGKGHKDRLVPLPKSTLHALRRYWKVHQNTELLFPNILGGTDTVRNTKKAMNIGCVQAAFRAAVKDSGINKKVSVHSLRHSYATHLIESNVNLKIIQHILGHSQIVTTARYTHFTKVTLGNSDAAINEIMSKIHFHDL
jgi:integrase/recombinase XerD